MLKLGAGAYRRMPWKNGGGVTLEIAIEPAGSGLEDFDWRISSAHVEAAGPFSSFSGIDRSLALLGGERMTIALAGRRTELVRGGPPLSFAGDVPVHAELPVGAVADFNVMTRRGRWTHRLAWMHLDAACRSRADADVVLLYCAAGVVLARWDGGGAAVLEVGDSLIVEDAWQPLVHLEPSGHASLLVVRLWRCRPAVRAVSQASAASASSS